MRLSISAAAILLASSLDGCSAFVPSSLDVGLSRTTTTTSTKTTTSPTTTTSLRVATDPRKTASSSTDVNNGGEWSPSSWKNAVAKQMPVYEDLAELDRAVSTLNRVAPLVFAGEVRSLHEKLARVTQGQGFVLMGGDCAESFKEFHVNHIRDTFRVLMQMALVLTFGSAMPVVKIGRMAGQFAKERSESHGRRILPERPDAQHP